MTHAGCFHHIPKQHSSAGCRKPFSSPGAWARAGTNSEEPRALFHPRPFPRAGCARRRAWGPRTPPAFPASELEKGPGGVGSRVQGWCASRSAPGPDVAGRSGKTEWQRGVRQAWGWVTPSRSWGLSNSPGRTVEVPWAEAPRPTYGLAAEGTRLAQRGLSCWSPGSPRSGDMGTPHGEADLGTLSRQQSRERALWVPVRPARFLSPNGKFLLLVLARAFPRDPRRRWSLESGRQEEGFGGKLGGKFHCNIFLVKLERGVLDGTYGPNAESFFPSVRAAEEPLATSSALGSGAAWEAPLGPRGGPGDGDPIPTFTPVAAGDVPQSDLWGEPAAGSQDSTARPT